MNWLQNKRNKNINEIEKEEIKGNNNINNNNDNNIQEIEDREREEDENEGEINEEIPLLLIPKMKRNKSDFNNNNNNNNNTRYIQNNNNNNNQRIKQLQNRQYKRNKDNGIGTHQYEDVENEIWKHHQLQRKFGTRSHWWTYENKRVFRKWAQTFLIGCCTGLVAYLVVFCTSRIMLFKFHIVYSLIEMEREGIVHFGSAFLFFTIFNLICIIIAWFTVYIAPAAAGSGIPEVKSFLNGVNLNVLESKTLVSKAIGIIFTVSGGLPAGKEGPMIHMGSSLAVLLSQSTILTKLFGLDSTFKKFQDYHNDREKRDFVACGAASGVAAAFGAPIGGVLFSLEEGASFWSTKLTWRSFFCAMTTVTTLFVIRTVNIHLGQANANAMFSFGQFYKLQGTVYNFSVFELPVFCLIGGLGGLLGAASNEANKRLHSWRMKSFINNIYARLREVLFISLLVSTCSFWLPVLIPSCTPRPINMEDWNDQEKSLVSRLVPLYCDPTTEYSQLGSLFLTDTDTAIKQLFHFRELGNNLEPTFSSKSLLVFFVVYSILTCLNYGTAVPSGMFVPSLLQGAAFGRLIGHLLHFLDHRKGTFADSGTFALIGAAGGLGGMARMTISLTVIILEATGDVQYIVPLMLTVMFARFVGNIYNEGLYDIHIKLKKVPFLHESEDTDTYIDLSVADVMTRDPICFTTFVSVGHVYDVLKECKHESFPIVDTDSNDEPNRTLLGTVPRKILCTLILYKAFGYYDKKPSRSEERISPLVDWGALEKFYPNYPDIDDVILSSHERDGWIDLRPYMERGPHILYSSTTFQRGYKIFRTLGLSHLFIINSKNALVGIITRSELLPEHISRCEKSIYHDELFFDEQKRKSLIIDSINVVNSLNSGIKNNYLENNTSNIKKDYQVNNWNQNQNQNLINNINIKIIDKNLDDGINNNNNNSNNVNNTQEIELIDTHADYEEIIERKNRRVTLDELYVSNDTFYN